MAEEAFMNMSETQAWRLWISGLVIWMVVAPILGMILGLNQAWQLSFNFVYFLCLAVGVVGAVLNIAGEIWLYQHRHEYHYRDLL